MQKLMKLGLVAIMATALLAVVSCAGGAGVKKDTGEKLGPEMVKDGNFPDGCIKNYSIYNALSAAIEKEVGGKWTFQQAMPAKGSFEIKDGVFKLLVESPGNDNWQIQLVQFPMPLKFGKKYKMSFDAKADKPRKIVFKVGKIGGDWLAYSGLKVFDITTEWQTISFVFKSIGADDKARVEFNISQDPNSVYLRNVSLREVLE